MWNAITLVTSGLTLVAFLVAVGAFVYSNSMRRKERLISTAEESDRAALVQDALEFFHVDSERLTKQQAYDLAMEQIRARAKRFQTSAFVIVVMSIILAIVTAYVIKGGDNPLQITQVETDLYKLQTELDDLSLRINNKQQEYKHRLDSIRPLMTQRDAALRAGDESTANHIQNQIDQIGPKPEHSPTNVEFMEKRNLEYEIELKRDLLARLQSQD